MKCPHCHKTLFYNGKYDAGFFMTKGQRDLMKLLCEERLVTFDEISPSRRGAFRMVEELRKTLQMRNIKLQIRSVRGLGYLLVDPAASEEPPTNGHFNQRPVDDEAGINEGASP